MIKDKQLLALFPGQGSQKTGMGQNLYNTEDKAKELFERANKVLGFSLTKLCFEGPQEELTLTHIAQPAILTVSCICFELFKDKTDNRVNPVISAGHSLGEYSALVCAGAISFDDAVLLVHKRGRYMQEAVPKGQGSMLAILGKEVEEIELAIKKVEHGTVEIANINAPGQIVVAGDMDGLNKLKEIMKGSKIMELNVSAPFHCKLMQPAADNLKKDLAAITFNKGNFPVISNYSAAPVCNPDEIRRSLENQVCGRVRWVESMKYAVNTFPEIQSIEFGSGNVLNGMLKRISPETNRFNVTDNQESFAQFGN